MYFFLNRNNFVNSWDHVLSQCEYTYYVNHALGHKSIIDHFIVTRNIDDVIEANYVILLYYCLSPVLFMINCLLIECSQIIYMYVNQYVPGIKLVLLI